jgi:serine/threonine protein phosphatase 1
MSRTFAIGDVHGCDTALATLLNRIRPGKDDTVIFLGDLVDRGPGTREVLEQVVELRRQCCTILIQGNHEEMMLGALAGEGWTMWMQFGGDKALESYGGQTNSIPPSHIHLLESAVDYFETSTAIFVHARLQHGVPLSEQGEVCLRWTHLRGDEPWYDPPRRVICGHTPQKNGYPLVFPGWVCIDTDCQRGGWLTALDTDSNWVYQANQQGQTRDFALGNMA